MATSLYDLSVPTFLQTVKAVGGFLDRAARHCAETRADPNDLVHARLFDDMAPYHFQIEAAWHHSVWGLEAVKTGEFAPPALVGPVPFAGLRAMIGKSAVIDGLHDISWQAITLGSIAQLLVAVYGGYFGAGLGFMILGMLAMLGMRDIHAMAAIRTLLAAAVNAAAVVTFIVAHAVLWPQCMVMIAGSLAGGWFGAHYAQKADPRKVRGIVIAVGVAMTAYFFITVR